MNRFADVDYNEIAQRLKQKPECRWDTRAREKGLILIRN